jgi:hypothetical protein
MSNQNSHGHVSDGELAPVVENLLKEMGAETLTVEDVLSMTTKPARDVRILAVTFFRKQKEEREAAEQSEEARKRQELVQKKADEAARVSALLREKMGMKPLTSDILKEQMEVVATNGKIATDIFPPSEIPEAVIELSKKFDKMLLSDVFENYRRATTFRGWLCLRRKNNYNEMAKPNLLPEYMQALQNRHREISGRLDAIGEVILAWGGSIQDKTSYEEFNELCKQLDVEGSKFYWLTQAPKVETPEEKAIREKEQAKQKHFYDLVGRLKDQLTATNENLSGEAAQKMARGLAKKYGNFQSMTAIFTTAAINRMVSAVHSPQKEYEEGVAKLFANAGLMTDEELEVAVSARCKQHADDAQAQSEKVLQDKVHEGVMKLETVAAHASKKNGQKPKKDKKRGQQARQ